MKQAFITFFCMLIVILLAACSGNGSFLSEQESSSIEDISVTTIEGLSCRTEQDTYSTDTTVIKILLENQTNSSYSFDSNISIIEKLENNQWIILPLNNDALNLGAGVSLKQGKSAQAELQTSIFLDNPTPGRYRAILPMKSDDTNEEYNLSAEFNLK